MAHQYVKTSIEEEEYLNRHDLTFSKWTHRDFERDIKQEKNNKHKDILQVFTFDFVIIGIGLTFILFSSTYINILIVAIITFIIGMVFIVYGVIMFILELKDYGR